MHWEGFSASATKPLPSCCPACGSGVFFCSAELGPGTTFPQMTASSSTIGLHGLQLPSIAGLPLPRRAFQRRHGVGKRLRHRIQVMLLFCCSHHSKFFQHCRSPPLWKVHICCILLQNDRAPPGDIALVEVGTGDRQRALAPFNPCLSWSYSLKIHISKFLKLRGVTCPENLGHGC